MEPKIIRCPACAADLDVSPDADIVVCQYCGADVQVRETSSNGRDVNNLFELADLAFESKEYMQAYGYYSNILEKEHGNPRALLGKIYSKAELNMKEGSGKNEGIRVLMLDNLNKINGNNKDKYKNEICEYFPYTFKNNNSDPEFNANILLVLDEFYPQNVKIIIALLDACFDMLNYNRKSIFGIMVISPAKINDLYAKYSNALKNINPKLLEEYDKRWLDEQREKNIARNSNERVVDGVKRGLKYSLYLIGTFVVITIIVVIVLVVWFIKNV